MELEKKGRAEKLAASLTAETVELLPYLPYLLQDFWELGTSALLTADMAARHVPEPGRRRVLDLACGKGAVSIALAERFKARVTGIDLMPDFITEARARAEAAGLADLCEFRVADVNEAAESERGYDLVIWGAAGDVLGPPPETLDKLMKTVVDNGFILIDEAFAKPGGQAVRYGNYPYLTRESWGKLFAARGLKVLEEVIGESAGDSSYAEDLGLIARRAEELSAVHPDKRPLFQGYVQSQANEYQDLADAVVGVAWLLVRT